MAFRNSQASTIHKKLFKVNASLAKLDRDEYYYIEEADSLPSCTGYFLKIYNPVTESENIVDYSFDDDLTRLEKLIDFMVKHYGRDT